MVAKKAKQVDLCEECFEKNFPLKFNVVIVEKYSDRNGEIQRSYTPIGNAISKNLNMGIKVYLKAYPKNGELILYLPREDE